MSTEQEREAFEKWWDTPNQKTGHTLRDLWGNHHSQAWEAWQARAALAQPELVAESARTANEKLRADQMTKRLDMCNRMRNGEKRGARHRAGSG